MKLVAALLLLSLLLAGQDRKEYRFANMPGTLETAVSGGQQTVVRYELGSLTPPGVVRVFAVVAIDESTKHPTMGLEVQLEGDDLWNGNRHCKKSAYIDQAGLGTFERSLNLVASKGRDMTDSQGSRSEIPQMLSARNTASGQPKDGVFYVPVQFGYYWTGSRFGVYAKSPALYPRPIKASDLACQVNMPEADISELLRLVRGGRELLTKEGRLSGEF